MRIDITMFDGVDELDVIGPHEVFRSAANLGGRIDARLVSRVPTSEIRAAYGLRFRPDGVFEPGEADVLIVPEGDGRRETK
jgi:putative intracellular protease/amidase